MAFDIRHQYVVSRQIIAHGNFSAPILESFEKTPRHFFMPPTQVHKAYVEEAVRIAPDRLVMMPLVLARLMKHLPLVPDKNIMIAGGSTGYSAALLSYHASTVFLLEEDDRFKGQAQAGLSALHIDNVVLCQGTLKEGLARQGPFHFIFIEGGVDYVPSCFFDQLTETGTGVFACARQEGMPIGQMTRFWRDAQGLIHQDPLFEMPCYPIKEFCHPPKFEF